MSIHKGVRQIILQLRDTIDQLTDEQYSQPIALLSDASIGQHIRHIEELFICVLQGYEHGTVNYEKRRRDKRIEQDRNFARTTLAGIFKEIEREDKPLLLESCVDELSEEIITIKTNYLREIVYNLEHAIHHMALIRIGIRELTTIDLPENFGVATSTMKYRLKTQHS